MHKWILKKGFSKGSVALENPNWDIRQKWLIYVIVLLLLFLLLFLAWWYLKLGPWQGELEMGKKERMCEGGSIQIQYGCISPANPQHLTPRGREMIGSVEAQTRTQIMVQAATRTAHVYFHTQKSICSSCCKMNLLILLWCWSWCRSVHHFKYSVFDIKSQVESKLGLKRHSVGTVVVWREID